MSKKSRYEIIEIIEIGQDAKEIYNKKQVRTNIGLADTLIPSSFIYLI